jgi:hypothetical protein
MSMALVAVAAGSAMATPRTAHSCLSTFPANELNFQTISRTGKTVDSGVIKRAIRINHAVRFCSREQLLSAYRQNRWH